MHNYMSHMITMQIWILSQNHNRILSPLMKFKPKILVSYQVWYLIQSYIIISVVVSKSTIYNYIRRNIRANHISYTNHKQLCTTTYQNEQDHLNATSQYHKFIAWYYLHDVISCLTIIHCKKDTIKQ